MNDQTLRVLVVEDELTLLEALEYNLRKEGYEVLLARDGAEAIDVVRDQHPDCIILDLMLPRIDGFEVCRIVRQEMSVPILMLTARADEIDKIVGLEVGADDYMTKPFSMRELMARVRALLRRDRLIREELAGEATTEGIQRETALRFGDLTVDLNRRQAFRSGTPLSLRPKEFELLAFLARNRGMVLSRDLILERVWGWSYSGGSRTVDVHIRWLREKIEIDPASPERILTIRGAGYLFEG
jgi:DNA-binding response OmpR family regulator